MCINFVCKTNKDYVMINVANFQYPDGRKVTIDRDWTNFGFSTSGKLFMTWENCYFWDGEDVKYLDENDYVELNKAKFLNFELEDEADADYKVSLISFKSY